MGFRRPPFANLLKQEGPASVDVQAFVDSMFDGPEASALYAAARRTDTRFRTELFARMREGAGRNQRQVLTHTGIPTAIVNGADDAVVNLDYFDTVPYGHLWKGRCFRLEKAGHAPFWDAPERYDALLLQFLADLL